MNDMGFSHRRHPFFLAMQKPVPIEPCTEMSQEEIDRIMPRHFALSATDDPLPEIPVTPTKE
jgi:hypothetical protein